MRLDIRLVLIIMLRASEREFRAAGNAEDWKRKFQKEIKVHTSSRGCSLLNMHVVCIHLISYTNDRSSDLTMCVWV